MEIPVPFYDPPCIFGMDRRRQQHQQQQIVHSRMDDDDDARKI
jgi:hypothetical protein